MSEFSSISCEINEHIARLVLKRPETGNAINAIMAQEFQEACCRIRENNDIYIVIITGSGNKFCVGSDTPIAVRNVAEELAGIEQPVIAAVNGDAIGQGLELILSCDIRIAVPQARFGLPHMRA